MSDAQNDGFLRRWSNRKSDARQGKALAPEPAPDTPLPPKSEAAPPVTACAGSVANPVVPTPTLQDVEPLTPASDFSAFVQREVPADVKNAAMKKLFADPHFNVMDGLDVYIDDYSHPDPLAPAMLRQMASAQFLKLADEPQEEAGMLSAPDTGIAAEPQPESVAQYDTHRTPSQALDHDHADLRLQPDPNTGPQDTGSDSV